MMNIHCCSKWTHKETRKSICLLLCLSVTCLITYRVHIWLKHYDSLASKMIISAYDDHQNNLPFPLITICNINPARGTKLYNLHSSESRDRGIDYEIFADALQGRLGENIPESKLQMPIIKLIDKASHQIDQMLRGCKIGQKHCSVANFTKSVLPNGACYTLSGDLVGIDEIQLVLDPQSYDYLVPNQGFIGFRILLHGYGDSLWAQIPTAVYAGPTFHTMLRTVGLKKIYKQHCTSQSVWASCMHDCMQEMLEDRCHCQLSDCTIMKMMNCGLTINSMIESLSPVQCKCHNPCETISYSVESITQALKSPLLFTHPLSVFTNVNQSNFESDIYANNNVGGKANPFTQKHHDIMRSISNTINNDNNNHKNVIMRNNKDSSQPQQYLHSYKKEIWEGLLLQTWAFLREANRTAFEQLRQLSHLLQSLDLDLQTVERTVYKVHRKHRLKLEPSDLMLWDGERLSTNKQASNGLCMDSEEHSRMLERVSRLGKEFVRLFRQSILFRDISVVPGSDFHIHLVRLFFLRVVEELDRLANQLLHNDLFSDVTMLDLQRKTHLCKQSSNELMYNDTSWENQLKQSQPIVASEDIASLQAVLLATDSQFKQLRTVFSKLVSDNRELIEALPIDRASLNSKPESLSGVETGLVTITIQLTQDKNRLIRLESVQAIYSPIAELLDLIISGLLLAFLSIFLVNICLSKPSNSVSCYSESCRCCSSLVNKPADKPSTLLNHTTVFSPTYSNRKSENGNCGKPLPKTTATTYVNHTDLTASTASQIKTSANSAYLCNSRMNDRGTLSSRCLLPSSTPITNNKTKLYVENCRHNYNNPSLNDSSQYLTHTLPILPVSSVILPKWESKTLRIDLDPFNSMNTSEHHSAVECEDEQSHLNINHLYSPHQQQQQQKSLPQHQQLQQQQQQSQQSCRQQNNINESSCISFCDCLYSSENSTGAGSFSCTNSNKYLLCNN
uniref:Amiloride-sensitive sodium channel n=1 Tax=Trichobilharzia regenti TaxID=157069 RepID=A0AA85IMM8_TRIRE